MNNALYDYIVRHNRLVHPAMDALRDETQKMTMGMMQISHEQGCLMHLLTKAIGAKRVVEVGCFTGYSAICMALALPSDGRLVTFDISEEYASIARRYFSLAGVANKIDLRIQPALMGLPQLESEFGLHGFDCGFIDADKENILAYYEHVLKLVRPGGLIFVDNVLWDGKVALDYDETPCTMAIRAFNKVLFQDSRVDFSLTTIADGLAIVRKV